MHASFKTAKFPDLILFGWSSGMPAVDIFADFSVSLLHSY